MKPTILFLTCEHAVNTVPPEYRDIFQEQEEILSSDLAFDPGALEITQQLSRLLSCRFTQGRITRLLIDCNRDLNHKDCLSIWTNKLSEQQRQTIIADYYEPFRKETLTFIQQQIKENHQVLHISIHSFNCTRKRAGEDTAISLLYDPLRHGEKEVARLWRRILRQQQPTYRIRMNYPQKIHHVNFQNHLRHQYAQEDYLGIAIEMNQVIAHHETYLQEITLALANSLQELMQIL